MPKSDPPFNAVEVAKEGMDAAAVAPGLPKPPKSPGALAADVAGTIVVVLEKVGVGNAPKSEGALGGSVYKK